VIEAVADVGELLKRERAMCLSQSSMSLSAENGAPYRLIVFLTGFHGVLSSESKMSAVKTVLVLYSCNNSVWTNTHLACFGVIYADFNCTFSAWLKYDCRIQLTPAQCAQTPHSLFSRLGMRDNSRTDEDAAAVC
jgi:hypothetical protein